MPSIADILANKQATNIKRNKTKFRREQIVAAGKLADAAKADNPKGSKALTRQAENLRDSSEANAARRMVERKFRAHGGHRRIDAEKPVDPEAMRNAGKLRTKASELGYKVKAAISKAGGKTPEVKALIDKAQALRRAADKSAEKAIGVRGEDSMGREWTEEEKQGNAEKTMKHYSKKAEEGDKLGKRVVEGYKKNRHLQDMVQAYGVSVSSQISKEKAGRQTGAKKTAAGMMRSAIMAKRTGRRIRGKYHGHISTDRNYGNSPTSSNQVANRITGDFTSSKYTSPVKKGSYQSTIRKGSVDTGKRWDK